MREYKRCKVIKVVDGDQRFTINEPEVIVSSFEDQL